jgi:tRNA nucleotidyltransferase (CCA-adding enzyme)
MKKLKIPKSVQIILTKLEIAGFEAFVVGGCVRDILLKKNPKDWDITTNATPTEIKEVFPDGKYENDFGTVIISDKYLTGHEIVSDKSKITLEIKEKLLEIAKEKYLKKIKCKGHGLLHAEQVTKNALEIAKNFKRIKPEFIEIIAMFHDAGRAEVENIEKNQEKHVKKSQEILVKESEIFLEKGKIKLLKEAVFHNSNFPRQSLEAQILVEADLIDGICTKRINSFEKEAKKAHLGWVEDYFNKNGAFGELVTLQGKELMGDAVDNFNEADFGFKIAQIETNENKNIEITTFRIETKYSDKRHPDQVKFAKTLKEDLSRRDFTINAMALKKVEEGNENIKQTFQIKGWEIIDLFEGLEDLQNLQLRAVGDANERFDEDALRMLRAVRFATTLSFEIEENTKKAVEEKIANMSFVSKERIRDEFEKIMLADNPAKGIELLVEMGLMKYVIPEIVSTIGVEQNHHHYYGKYNTVYKHLVASLAKCPSKKIEVRLAALLHDIGKPSVKEGVGENATFYNHEYVGAKMVQKILERLKFKRKIIDKTVLLIRNHMFYYNVDEVGEAGVRRVVSKVGKENIKDLIDVRIGDRLGSGVPKAVPYKLRHFQYMVEKVSTDPISVKQLKIDGNILIKELKIAPGPQIGAILEVLLAEVIEDPKINEKKKLLHLAESLKNENLAVSREQAKSKIKKENKKDEEKTKRKHWVK